MAPASDASSDRAARRCSVCIISEHFPAVDFDDGGVCSVCRAAEGAVGDELALRSAGKRLEALLAERDTSKQYDAVLCNSGGKDSSYTLVLAVKKYGLRVLSFTLDNGFLSSFAFRNINAMVEALGVDHVTVKPSSSFYNSVVRTSLLGDVWGKKSLTRISSGCNACISLVNTTALKLALEKRIPFILAGFTLGQIPTNGIIYRNHYRFLQESRQRPLALLREAVGDDVDKYYGISEELLAKTDDYPFNVNLLCLEHITELAIAREVEKYGWKRPRDVDGCSSNCRLNTFNNLAHIKRHGYSPYELELSQLIREKLMTREEALGKLADQPIGHLAGIMAKLGVTLEELPGRDA